VATDAFPAVFISHSSRDHVEAGAVCAALEAAGVPCWIAPRDIAAGVEWSAAIVRGLHGSRLLLLLYTAASNESPQVLREVERMVALRRPVVGVRREGAPVSPELAPLTGSVRWFAASETPLEERLPELVAFVKDALSSGGEAAGSATPSSPRAVPADGDTLPGNLPAPVEGFIGREREVAAAYALLLDDSHAGRLVTLTGMGGVGKTRLSLEVAHALAERRPAPFPDGVFAVELASVADPALVPQAVADALSVRVAGADPAAATHSLAAALKGRRLLLLLDNAEHLVGAVAGLTAALLRECPGVRLLVTSRERLGVTGERVLSLDPLPVPGGDAPQEVAESAAGRLFVERARAVRDGFALDADNAPVVAAICRHLDGIPLALELAAARTRSLAPAQIAERLDQRFRLLTGGSRDLLPRQQTLRAMIDWSYGLLTGPEAALLRRLAVFAGGWTMEAAEGVCADPSGGALDEWEVLDLLGSLADKSLIVVGEGDSGGTPGAARYRMLETVRSYASERLEEEGALEQARARHATFFRRLAAEAAPNLRGAEQARWLARLSAEMDNLRAALDALSADASVEEALAFARDLGPLWTVRGHYAEGRERVTRLLGAASSAGVPEARRARAQVLLGTLMRLQGDHALAAPVLEEALAWAQDGGDVEDAAAALEALGIVAAQQGEYARARSLLRRSLDRSREAGDRAPQASAWNSLGNVAFSLGENTEAAALYDEAAAAARREGNQNILATAGANRGMILRALGRLDESAAVYDESIAAFRSLGNLRGVANTLGNLAATMVDKGERGRACDLLSESIALLRRLGEQQMLTFALNNLAGVLAEGDASERAAARGYAAEALRLAVHIGDRREAAQSLRHLAGIEAERDPYRATVLDGAAEAIQNAAKLPALEDDALRKWEARRARARAVLSPDGLAAATAQGRAMSLPEAAAYVVGNNGVAASRGEGAPPPA
jgi:predicted ATPase